MLKNYLLITFRSMMKNKLFITINVLGLAIAVGCCIVAYFNWEFDYRFDKQHTNRETIYRVNSVREFNNVTTGYGYVPAPLGLVVQQNFKDVTRSSRFSRSFSNYKLEDNLFSADLAYVDTSFFNMFSFEFLYGDASAINQKSSALISDELALKMFGSKDVVGKQFTQVINEKNRELVVGAVYKSQPASSSFTQGSYLNYENFYEDAGSQYDRMSWKNRCTFFIQIKDPGRVKSVTDQLQPYKENNNKVREDFLIARFEVDPFVGMARRDESNDTWSDTQSASPIAAVVAPAIMALLILLIACFNMTNTAIAISSRRLKEIGIRKVMGSMRKQLIIQFMGETFIICTIGFLLGLVLGEVLLTAWNSLWENMKLTSNYSGNLMFVAFLIGMLLLTAVLSGGYPSVYISKFEPVSILKGKLKFGGTNMFTRILLLLQYAFSLVGIVFSIGFYNNSLYQKSVDLGFRPNEVMIAYVNNKSEYDTYSTALSTSKEINKIAGAKHSIFSSRYNDPVKYQSEQVEVDIIEVGDGYLDVMGLTLLSGRDFIKDSETDRKESIIVTEKLVKQFNWDNPIGKELIWMDTVKLYVIGVVKDVYTIGLWREMDPMMIRYTSPDNYTHVLVNAPAGNLPSVNRFMEAEWKKTFPNRLYNGRFVNEDIAEAATVNNNIVKMFLFLGSVALILSATGLFTLVSLNIIKKLKEIGVRKVLGASIGNITRIINYEFMIILGLAAIAGSALGFLGANALMASIWKYYQPTQAITIIVSVLVMFIVSAVSIGYKVYTAANTNPVNTLRSE